MISGTFHFNQNANAAGRFRAIMNYQILAIFGVDGMQISIPGVFEKSGDEVFMKLFRFAIHRAIQQLSQIGFEKINIRTANFAFKISLVKRIADGLGSG
jgi:hypothetical protein